MANWRIIHEIAISEIDSAKWLGMLQACLLMVQVGCGKCSKHMQEFMAMDSPDLPTPEERFAWSVRFHNAVNRKMGKAEVSVEEARGIYTLKGK